MTAATTENNTVTKKKLLYSTSTGGKYDLMARVARKNICGTDPASMRLHLQSISTTCYLLLTVEVHEDKDKNKWKLVILLYEIVRVYAKYYFKI